MSNTFYAPLSEHFPKEVERELRKGGALLTYIPVSEVITRLNRVVGVDRWSYTILNCERDAGDPDFAVAHVRLSVTFVDDTGERVVTKDGIGGQRIKRKKDGELLDLGDDMKGAVSDALKKAAQSLGIGLYLARSEEAMYLELEVVDDEPISQEHFLKLSTLISEMSADLRAKAFLHWDAVSSGKPFERQSVTRPLLEGMLAFIKQNRESV